MMMAGAVRHRAAGAAAVPRAAALLHAGVAGRQRERMNMTRRVLSAAAVCAATHAAHGAPLRQELLDDFKNAALWQASASDQVRAALRVDPADGGLCLDYDFGGVSGYAVMQRELPVDWPQHFDLRLRFKGSGAVNDFQMKLVDASGDNVWWINRPAYRLPGRLTEIKLRRRHIDFAWGPHTRSQLAPHAHPRVRHRCRAERWLGRPRIAVRVAARAGGARARSIAVARAAPQRARRHARPRLPACARVQRRCAALAGQRQAPARLHAAGLRRRQALAAAAPRGGQRRWARRHLVAGERGASSACSAAQDESAAGTRAARQHAVARRQRRALGAGARRTPGRDAARLPRPAELLGPRRRGRWRRALCLAVRRRCDRDRPRRLLDRAGRADRRRPSAHLGRREGRAVAARRLSADPRGALASRRVHARHRGRGRRHARCATSTRALHPHQPQRQAAPLHAAARRAAVAGQSAAAIPDDARRIEPGAPARMGRRRACSQRPQDVACDRAADRRARRAVRRGCLTCGVEQGTTAHRARRSAIARLSAAAVRRHARRRRTAHDRLVRAADPQGHSPTRWTAQSSMRASTTSRQVGASA